jgi:hypothetical protein
VLCATAMLRPATECPLDAPFDAAGHHPRRDLHYVALLHFARRGAPGSPPVRRAPVRGTAAPRAIVPTTHWSVRRWRGSAQWRACLLFVINRLGAQSGASPS